MENIDFVILWVDGNDKKWLEEKNKYKPKLHEDSGVQRYRDWGTLKYWFRGIEKYTPWVNKVFFVTYGHIPSWLDVNNEKLHIVKHSDFIPPEYLPTFNANVIHQYLYRINELSNYFVLFDDDTYVIKSMDPKCFFNKGLPCDTAVLTVHSVDMNVRFTYASINAVGLINKYFDFHKVIAKYWYKWLSPLNGYKVLRTVYLLPCKQFPGIMQTHLPNSFLKQTFEELWCKEPKLFEEVASHRFRSKYDYSQWTMKCWQLCTGRFYPRRSSIGKTFNLDEDRIETIANYIIKQKGKMVCVNDGHLSEQEFMYDREYLTKAFDTILPEKSSFEIVNDKID